MKSFLLFFFAPFLVIAQIHQVPNLLLDDKLNPEIADFFHYMEIDVNQPIEGISLNLMNLWHQNEERWEMDDRYKDKEEEITYFLQKLHVYEDVVPSEKKFDYLLFHGALLSAMQSRLEYLLTLWEMGIRFDTIVILSGERCLLAKEKEIIQNEDINTESELALYLFQSSELPNEMKEIPVITIHAPQKNFIDGTKKRPTTIDVFAAWLDTNPKPGSCLAISSQPYVGYQQAIGKNILPSTFSLFTCGKKCSSQVRVSVHLDNIAKWFYQEALYNLNEYPNKNM